MTSTPARRRIGISGAELTTREEGGRSWPVLVWAPGPGWRMAASTVTGGGIGERQWWLNTQVPREYHEPDPAAHLARIAAGLGLTSPGERDPSPGVGMLTAADVARVSAAGDHGVDAVATVGLGLPVWAARSPDRISNEPAGSDTVLRPGTINVLVVCPVPLSDAALINAVVTLTEAKTQALFGAGIDGSGTSSDAVCIACPMAGPLTGAAQPYAGPRSQWGARIARATHAAVRAGTADWLRTFGPPGTEQPEPGVPDRTSPPGTPGPATPDDGPDQPSG